MSTENTSSPSDKGPTGFITDGQNTLVVEDGHIYKDGQAVGFLFEDGYIKNNNQPLGKQNKLSLIENISPWQFRGIDCQGLEIVLPDEHPGPSGKLEYNAKIYNVINGRVVTEDHKYVGQITDSGEIFVRDKNGEGGKVKVEGTTLLNFTFEGISSTGANCQHQFRRPLYKIDRTYIDNEIIRYFDGFDALNNLQKKYVLETMALWSSCGLLQIVRKSEGDASLGNVKHGVTGVTRVRTGKVSLDKEEFEREVNYYKQHGAMMIVPKNIVDYLEVRLNLVLAHEFGHQVDFVLTSAVQEQVAELYEKKRKSCDKLHPLPDENESPSELLMRQQIEKRHFISGYAKSSAYEYWAESLAAFSIKTTRDHLREFDPVMYDILTNLVLAPTKVLSRVFHENITSLQASLKLGGEFLTGGL